MVIPDKEETFDRDKLKIQRELAKGSFGRVYDATYENLPAVVKSSLQEDKNKLLMHEYKVLKYLQRNKVPGIPQVTFSFTHNNKLYYKYAN